MNHYARAILRYDDAASNTTTITKEPQSSRLSCTTQKKCIVLNCMFLDYPTESNTQCLRVDQLNSASSNQMEPEDVIYLLRKQNRCLAFFSKINC